MAASPEAQALLERWRNVSIQDTETRDEILNQLIENRIFPGKEQEEYEIDGRLYPDSDDPKFVVKLMKKREFQDSKQKSVKESFMEGEERCRTTEDFEITPVQRFVSRLLSPRTPYHSALLYHGVGVGKTCAAITVAESYLHEFPGKKVYIIAPPNIQEGFKRTIFDREGLRAATKTSIATHRGCTGNTYLEITGSLTESNITTIENRVAKAIKARYEFFGYTSFYNHIMNILSTLPKLPADRAKELEQMKLDYLRREFSDRVIIIDEAHNLRDNPLEADDEVIDDTTASDTAESKAGKKLTPYLREVLSSAEGITLLLMTATPMYNSYVEIVFLLNLLLTNDKFERMRPEEIFDLRRSGDESPFLPGGDKLLGKVASQYISFMRGENPLTFPIRLEPLAASRVRRWPSFGPKGDTIESIERGNCTRLPFIGGFFKPESETLYMRESEKILQSSEGLGIANMDILVQAGNWIFPGDVEDDFLDRIRQQGFDNTFSKQKKGNLTYFKNINEELGASWLLDTNLAAASGKCAVLLKRLNAARGVTFVYSRFVASGALTIALALEANGYTCWNRDIGFLAEGNQHPQGRQCALCPRHENQHGTVPEEAGTAAHSFKPAKYVLLTGSEELSPNNAKSIDAARGANNKYGEEVKVILGSQIAGEGLDLRYIREILVFDSWYHLNKLEQVVGRGIRNCSHVALPQNKRNCTVSLLVNSYATNPEKESIDMYSYRQALKKAITVGNVTRVLKEYAIDCTLNREAIMVKNLDPIPLILDSQGAKRENQNVNDVPLTPMCDWLQTCEYECRGSDGEILKTEVPLEEQDTSTYDEYTARFQIHKLRNYLEDRIVKGTAFVTFERIENDFSTIPRPLLASLLNEIVNKKEFSIHTEHGSGRIIFRNGFYLFQPDKLKDTSIPIALRMINIPIPRDHFTPLEVQKDIEEVGEKEEQQNIGVAEGAGELWKEVLVFAETIRNGSAIRPSTFEKLTDPQFKLYDELPTRLITEVEKLPESAGLMKTQKERLEMILRIFIGIKENEEVRLKFADIVIEFMWDEFLTFSMKKQILSTQYNTPIIKSIAKDAYWIMEGNTYLRLMKQDKNEIEYLCVDGDNVAPCPRAIIEVLEREKKMDPLLQRAIDVRYTGYEYGFIAFNPKKNRFVFKKGRPPTPTGKLGRGSECSINSGTTYELNLLERFGQTLRKAGQSDLGMNDIQSVATRKYIANSVRICTLSDLALRFMDSLKIEGKRWFYRPLEAKLHNHPLR